MEQQDIYAEVSVSGVRYQWLIFSDGMKYQINMYQLGAKGRWFEFRGEVMLLEGATPHMLLEASVSSWSRYSVENGHEVLRVA